MGVALRSLLLFLVAAGASCAAEALADAARELAKKIAGPPGEPIRVSVRKRTDREVDLNAVRRAVENALRGVGARVSDTPAGVEIRITVGENAQTQLLVAEVMRSGETTVAIVPVKLSETADSIAGGPVIDSRRVHEQETPMLDVAADGGRTVVLEPARVAIHEGGQLVASLDLHPDRPRPRDLRGRLILDGESFSAFLPGIECNGKLRPSPSIACETREARWPIDAHLQATFAPLQNSFDGTIESAGKTTTIAPFYSAARVDGGWVAAGVDGKARLLSDDWRELTIWPIRGADLASVSSACGKGAHLLIHEPAEQQAERIQIWHVAGVAAQPAGVSAEIQGRLTALWPARDPAAAIAIFENSATRRYVAYSLSVSCGR